MGFLDSVKGKFRRGDDDWDDRYDDYDEYEDYDNYDGESYDDYDGYAEEESARPRRASRSSFNASSRRESRLNDPTPLVSATDVRSQSYERAPINDNRVPDYTSGLQNYEIRTRGASSAGVGSSYTSDHSEDAIAAARKELEALKQGIHVPYNSIDPQPEDAMTPPPAAAPASPYKPIGSVSSSISKNMVTLTPTEYADAEKITQALKAGSSVVLSLNSIRPDQGRRILDFSFGAVSVVGGSASQIGNKVFYLSRTGAPITEAELVALRSAQII
ncbi:MAG: cell division protein SepF [bacterium]|nr:cell division protein SepF [bacterium]